MTDGLSKLRVTEKHGIRRFLYPLEARLMIPVETDLSTLTLRTQTGLDVPYCVIDRNQEAAWVRFAVSMAPLESLDLEFVAGVSASVPDGIRADTDVDGIGLRTTQDRLTMEIDDHGCLSRVFYDGIEHLKRPVVVSRNDTPCQGRSVRNDGVTLSTPIAAKVETVVQTADGATAHLVTELTACKSWVTLSLIPHDTTPGEVIVFTLPFAVTGRELLCDFGSGGGIYTKLTRKPGASVNWSVDGQRIWKLSNDGRLDYQGRISAWEQLWFHVVDDEKSIAVALTQFPDDCPGIIANIDSDGDIIIAFVAGTSATAYSICYHFLNDVPAIAAATSPQSILLPPMVEVID